MVMALMLVLMLVLMLMLMLMLMHAPTEDCNGALCPEKWVLAGVNLQIIRCSRVKPAIATAHASQSTVRPLAVAASMDNTVPYLRRYRTGTPRHTHAG
jgi:hypothetical protein